ncbi:MAG: hypothetical protein R3F34_09045 [Planctomycetota bacterium]
MTRPSSTTDPLGRDLVVLKFGSSVLRSHADLPRAVHEIYRHVRRGERVVAVVSAIGDATDRLLAVLERDGGDAPPALRASILAQGEREAAGLLALALDGAGVPSRVVDPASVLRAAGDPLDADPVALDTAKFERAFERVDVVVLPGFFAADAEGSTVLLGRGGSDTTAVFAATELGARRCVLLKDVDGLYESDPNADGAAPRRFATLAFDDAVARVRDVVHAPAAPRSRTRCTARGRGDRRTHAGREGPTRLATREPSRALRVGLVGLGTVGTAVLRLLHALPERFVVASLLVRDRSKPRDAAVDPAWRGRTASTCSRSDPDVVVELVGRTDAAPAPSAQRLVRDRRRQREQGAARRARPGSRTIGVGGRAPASTARALRTFDVRALVARGFEVAASGRSGTVNTVLGGARTPRQRDAPSTPPPSRSRTVRGGRHARPRRLRRGAEARAPRPCSRSRARRRDGAQNTSTTPSSPASRRSGNGPTRETNRTRRARPRRGRVAVAHLGPARRRRPC